MRDHVPANRRSSSRVSSRARIRFAELHAYSCFSFLEGAAHPEDLVQRAAELGLHALALTDRDGVYGAPRFHAALAEHGLRGVYGSDLSLDTGHRLTVLVDSLEGWRNLCRLVTRGRRAAAKGSSAVSWSALAEHARGLIALSGGGGPAGEPPSGTDGETPAGTSGTTRSGPVEAALRAGRPALAEERAARLHEIFGKGRFFLEMHHHHLAAETRLRGQQEELARRLGLRTVASNFVHYAEASARRLQDVLCCIRHRTTLDDAGRLLLPNGEFHLKGPEEMARAFRDHPRALHASVEIAERAQSFSLEQLRYRLPSFPVPDGETPFSVLHTQAHEGARRRYRPFTPKVARQLAHELDVIDRLGFAGYFLIVGDVVRFCKARNIFCQGRGSAANSAVCYALEITHVDPIGLDLLFERFLSEERAEAPDIDLDIEHERREEVLQYVYERYGREHAGMVCTFITFHARSALRDVGKALGLSEDQVRRAGKGVDHYLGAEQLAAELEGGGVTLSGLKLEGRMRHLPDLCRRIDGFPRHLSIHTGGMVIAAEALHDLVPIENATMPGRTVIQWDKDDVSTMGLVKIDLLGLGALSLMHRAVDLLREHEDTALDLAHLPHDDPDVYAMMCRADTVGVFQIESRAQMNCLPRLRPQCFYDLVVEVALIRPGPIQGKMVHPYLRRRQGREAVTYPHPCLKPILERTLGVPLFQEQGMRIAVAAAGFTASQADELRRAMGHRRSHRRMEELARRLVSGMAERGIDRPAAQRIFQQLAAFADFGFAESHAASFALLVYATAWMKHHHPAVYVTAILNAQPMGFYSPATLVHDARRHGVVFRSMDVQHSDWDCTLERGSGEDGVLGALEVRVGLRYARGLGEEKRERILRERARAPFRSPEDFGRRCDLSGRVLETLARIGAFASFGQGRRDALWQVQLALRDVAGPLAAELPAEDPVTLPAMSAVEELVEDYGNAGLSPDRQPMELLRAKLAGRRILGQVPVHSKALETVPHGRSAVVAGMVVCRQKPPTAKGFCFVTLEDETGMLNVVIPPQVYESHRALVRTAPFLAFAGTVERADGVLNLRAARCAALEVDFEVDAGSHDYH